MASPAKSSRKEQQGPITLSADAKELAIGLGWDELKGDKVDVDLSAVVFDGSGEEELDYCYYGQQKTAGLTLSGDNKTGEGAGDDETITINFDAINPKAEYIFVNVIVYSEGKTLKDMVNLKTRLYVAGEKTKVTRLPTEAAKNAIIMLMIVKSGSKWTINPISSYFDGVKQPTEESIVNHMIELREEEKRLAKKECLPADTKQLSFGVGWDMLKDERVDVDLAVVVFDRSGTEEIGYCYYGQKKDKGLTHSGDNRTGEGAGDDETVVVKLDELPAGAEHIFACLFVYTENKTFADMINLKSSLSYVNGSGEAQQFTKGRVPLVSTFVDAEHDTSPANALVSLHLTKIGSSWKVKDVNSFGTGRMYKDLLPAMIGLRSSA